MKTKLQLTGRHWETGAITNALALQGAKAPHTGKPYSEALLLGISGGIAFGYFTFEYRGLLPHLAILTRNTFDPLQTMLERMGSAQDVQQTTRAAAAEKSLLHTLGSGLFPILWADQFSLSYNALPAETMWAMLPILALEADEASVTVADRSSQPLQLSMEELTRARGRVKADRYRILTVDAPRPAKLAGAVHEGISQTIRLFAEEPPRGSRHNFGFAAYEKLAEMLVNTRNRQSWARFFAPGIRMYHALAGSPGQPGAYEWINTRGAADGAERALYADFLLEAAEILERPGLQAAAVKFRESHRLWLELAQAMLPDAIPLLGESRSLIQRQHDLFIEHGQAALEEIRQIHRRWNELIAESETGFPLTEEEAADLRASLRRILLDIAAAEKQAVDILQKVMPQRKK